MNEIGPKDTLSWQTFEYAPRENGKDWFLAVIMITLAVVFGAVMFGNYTLALFVVIGVSLLMYYSKRPPNMIEVTLTSSGIIQNDNKLPYSEIDAFWIETRFGYPRIIIRKKAKISGHVTILLGDTDPEEVRYFLGYYIDEEEQEESVFEHILHRLGF